MGCGLHFPADPAPRGRGGERGGEGGGGRRHVDGVERLALEERSGSRVKMSEKGEGWESCLGLKDKKELVRAAEQEGEG